MKKLKIGAVYKHYKGTRVKVLGEAFHSETLEPMVIYVHLEDGVAWARPKKMFLEDVKVPARPHESSGAGGGGKKVERFKKIKSKILIKPGK